MKSPDAYFQSLMQQLQSQASNNAQAIDGITTRQWMIPNDNKSWQGNVIDIESIKDAFDRSSLNETVQEATHKKQSSAIVAGAKLQCAYVGTMERAFRIRHRTAVRSLAQAANRRNAHGNYGGVFVGGVLRHVQNVLRES